LEPEQRLEAIAAADSEDLIRWADRILQTQPITITRGPTVGLLMVRHEEPVERSTFNFTECTVTEVEVLAGGTRGYAMVIGRNPARALAGAIVDVAIELEHALTADLTSFLMSAISEQEARFLEEWNQVAPTKVRFEESL
jgi:alpha-D-ribose 1-methylphosphonate 5-triphosphate synthase subunit PhnG